MESSPPGHADDKGENSGDTDVSDNYSGDAEVEESSDRGSWLLTKFDWQDAVILLNTDDINEILLKNEGAFVDIREYTFSDPEKTLRFIEQQSIYPLT